MIVNVSECVQVYNLTENFTVYTDWYCTNISLCKVYDFLPNY